MGEKDARNLSVVLFEGGQAREFSAPLWACVDDLGRTRRHRIRLRARRGREWEDSRESREGPMHAREGVEWIGGGRRERDRDENGARSRESC